MSVLGPFPAVATPGRPPADIFQVRRQRVPPGRGREWGEGQPGSPMVTRLSQRVRGMHRVLCRDPDPAGVQILGNLAPVGW